jgi:hypothetical protein
VLAGVVPTTVADLYGYALSYRVTVDPAGTPEALPKSVTGRPETTCDGEACSVIAGAVIAGAAAVALGPEATAAAGRHRIAPQTTALPSRRTRELYALSSSSALVPSDALWAS